MKVAALQMEAVTANIPENLARCERLANEAAGKGAEWIMLPEFFTTGMAYTEDLATAALPPDGSAMDLLTSLARRHHATVGGSFICHDADGHNRNAYFLVNPAGEVLGRHDKDLPTMWENCFYVGGNDDGVISLGGPESGGPGQAAGAAVCWEFMRTQTAERLRGRVDVVVGGSAWWSIPTWRPAALFDHLERNNARTAAGIAPAMARFVGAPVIHAAHSGQLECGLPWMPLRYTGQFEGGATICTADGEVVARRNSWEGPGFALADIDIARRTPAATVPNGFWAHRRGVLPALMWTMQREHGKRWYPRHTNILASNPNI